MFVEQAAIRLDGLVHDDVAVGHGAFATGIDSAAHHGAVVADDAATEDGLVAVVKVHAAAFGSGRVVADDAVGDGGAVAVAKPAAHRGEVARDDAVVELGL